MEEKDPAVSVIIPTYEEEKVLPHLLDCLEKQTFTDFEVIVADAGSQDGTGDIAETWGARVVEGGLPGVGRNRGAEHASGDYLLFLDADVEIEPNFIEQSLSEIKEKNIKFSGCEAVPLSDSAVDRVIHKTAFLMMKLTKNSNPRLPGYCMFFERKFFNTIGGFDEEVQLAEDYDLVRRAAEVEPLVLLESVQVYVSMRRFDKEGRLPYIGKGVKLFFHRKLKGEVRDNSFDYEFANFDGERDSVFLKKINALEKKISRLEKKINRKSPDDFPASVRRKIEKISEALTSLLNSGSS